MTSETEPFPAPTPARRAASPTAAPATSTPSGAILEAVAAVYERYGFEALDTGAFEYADALGKFLPDADRPNEGVFALQDDDEQWMALRYDLTAPLARFAAQNWETLPKPFRRYAFGPVWRNEKPGPGRYREFVQCDADTVGSARPEADAEIIAMAVEGLAAAGLPRGGLCAEDQQPQAAQRPAGRRRGRRPGPEAGGAARRRQARPPGPGGRAPLLGEGRKDESGAFTKGAGLDPAAIAADRRVPGLRHPPGGPGQGRWRRLK